MAVSDATLVRGTLEGDREAFAELYDRRAGLVRAICRDETGDADAASDLTQEVFLRAYRNLRRLDDPAHFAAWLIGITRWTCKEWSRSQSRHRPDAPDSRESTDPIDPTNSADEPLRRERALRLRQAVAVLRQRERLALYSYYLQEQDMEQARATMGLSRSGFYKLLASARVRLARALRENEVSQ